MLRNGRLREDRALLGVEPGGEVDGRDLSTLGSQLLGFDRLWDGKRVQIDDAEDVVVKILITLPLHERADIVADMQFSRRLDAGEHALFG
jgi:hypothetical protein